MQCYTASLSDHTGARTQLQLHVKVQMPATGTAPFMNEQHAASRLLAHKGLECWLADLVRFTGHNAEELFAKVKAHFGTCMTLQHTFSCCEAILRLMLA